MYRVREFDRETVMENRIVASIYGLCVYESAQDECYVSRNLCTV